MESLSDLVFGLALSIGALELLAKTPKTPQDLAASDGFFAFSFLIVIAIWLGYSRIIALMPQASALPFFLVDTPAGPLRFFFWYSPLAIAFVGIFNRRHERNQRFKKT